MGCLFGKYFLSSITDTNCLCVCFVDCCLSFCNFSFGHCVVCSSIYGFWLPLWFVCSSLIHGFWLPLWFVCSSSIYGFWLPLWFVCSSLIYGFWLPLWFVCSSSIYGFWLPLWYLQTLLTGLDYIRNITSVL
jgi:hypothetical protein